MADHNNNIIETKINFPCNITKSGIDITEWLQKREICNFYKKIKDFDGRDTYLIENMEIEHKILLLYALSGDIKGFNKRLKSLAMRSFDCGYNVDKGRDANVKYITMLIINRLNELFNDSEIRRVMFELLILG
jgi:hypothetical protein